ncbi:unnamed protein product, partial [Oncorhynchus mykiss]
IITIIIIINIIIIVVIIIIVLNRDLAELVDPRWPDPGSEWLYSVPWGFRRLLNFVKAQYRNPMIYVTENGVSEKIMCTELCDDWRIQYYKDYTNEMLKGITIIL